MKNFFDLFKRRSHKSTQKDSGMQKLLQSVAMTDEKELSCDDVFALLDQFAELVRDGRDAAGLMPLVQKHLVMCPDCREEYETLMKMMETPSQ